MTSRLNPYISFNGNAREALEYYKSVFGGDLTISTFAEFGMADAGADKVMHGQLETSDGYTLMGADTPPGMPYSPGNNMTVSLSGDTENLRGYFDRLADGGSVTMPMEKQAWGDEFGQCVDKFGVPWMVNIGQPR